MGGASGASGKKKGKSGSMLTVSTLYRDSLNNLMSMLKSTHPHFIRCIIPNEVKQSGMLDAGLVLNQLTCNGVLEGIRICRKGFPNRLLYPDFRQRYAVLAPSAAAYGGDDVKDSSVKMTDAMKGDDVLTDAEYKIGNTKIFFKAGILARLEEHREDAIARMIVKFQCLIRWHLAQKDAAVRKEQLAYYQIIQRSVKNWATMRTWPWYSLMGQVRLLIEKQKAEEAAAAARAAAQNQESEATSDKLRLLQEQLDNEKAARMQAENQSTKLRMEKNQLERDLGDETEKRRLAEEEVKSVTNELEDTRDAKRQVERARDQLQSENSHLQEDNQRLHSNLVQKEEEVLHKNREISSNQDEIAKLDQTIARLSHERKLQEEINRDVSDKLESEAHRGDRLEEQRKRVDDRLNEVTDDFEREKKLRADAEKARKRAENEAKLVNEALDQLRSQCKDMEMAVRKKDSDMAIVRNRIEEAEAQVLKLHAALRQVQARAEHVEELLEQEARARQRADKLRADLQSELDNTTQSLEEANGRLAAANHEVKMRQEEMAKLYQELDDRALNHEQRVAELFSSQYAALSRLRDIKGKMASLENDATGMQEFVHSCNVPQPGGPLGGAPVDGSQDNFQVHVLHDNVKGNKYLYVHLNMVRRPVN